MSRSALYVPGDAPDKLDKALGRGADELIVDLEDAVAPDRKEYAREVVADWLDRARDTEVGLWVRINPGPLQEPDVRAVAGHGSLRGFVVAKTESAEELVRLDALLDELGSDCSVVPLLESAAAVLSAREIAAAPRVQRLQVGEADLRADVGVTLGEDERELLLVRSHVVLVSAAAGIAPPIAPVSTEFRDLDAFRRSTEALARLGFMGRACIHPAQVEVCHQVFTPTAHQLAWAEGVLAALESAASGVALDVNGRMIDEAVARRARSLIARERRGPDQSARIPTRRNSKELP
ncbi:CoA ester lyase [Nocardioides gansuensis]|uniref:CoA ester lyase n=1 Tax=Nocardioides gansuensis TaxID=2138300 RepID=A0A2T8F537_9ACTN|nr:CoA ester lyase [Nocardioides gansuensis]